MAGNPDIGKIGWIDITVDDIEDPSGAVVALYQPAQE